MSRAVNPDANILDRILGLICRGFCFYLFIATVANILSISLRGTYFVSAPELSSDLMNIGLLLSQKGTVPAAFVVMGVPALLTSVPYLLGGIFHNRDRKWRLYPLWMYMLDSLTIGLDIFTLFTAGTREAWQQIIITLVVRTIGFTLLILPLKYYPIRIVRPEDTVVSTEPTVGVVLVAPGLDPALTADPHADVPGVRRVDLTRDRRNVIFADALEVGVTLSNGEKRSVGPLPNAQTVTLVVDETAASLSFRAPDGSGTSVLLPPGKETLRFTVTMTRHSAGTSIDVK